MQQDAKPTPVFDYATPPRRFAFHWPAAIVTAVIVLALNATPHFVRTVGPRVADIPEPELGWPWIFFFYGQTYAGYGPWWEFEHLAYDLLCGALIVTAAGHVAGRITTRR